MAVEAHGRQDQVSEQSHITMPAPTVWPFVLALGLAFSALGLLTVYVVSLIGIVISLLAAVLWWRQVIPAERHQAVRVDPALRPSPIQVEARSVIRLRAGEAQHRVRIPVEVHPYTAGIFGGLAGGAAMAALACLYGLIVQHSIWYPINLLAGVVLPGVGNETVEQLRAFDALAFGAACAGHIGISILMGVIYAVLLPMFPKYAPFWAGILMPLIWSGVIATILDLVNPPLNERVSWPWFVACQLAFGLVGGFVVARSTQIHTMQSWDLAERARLKAPGVHRDRNEP